ncbi:hypothetical protein IAT38_000380 [Cryptococcus sp. DSM 104549]
MAQKPLYTVPIADRPPHGPWTSKIFFPLLFNLAQLGINSAQFLMLPLLLIPFAGRRLFDSAIGWTKEGYGRLLERNANGDMTRINLPDRLVVMANHQAYLDWMYLWILSVYAGHSRGLVVLLKAALKNIPVVGWGMQFFNFIFMKRSWAADRNNLTLALTQLGRKAHSTEESETSSLLPSKRRSPLWLLIFPEGTIISDEERVKSVKYAKREGVDDFVTMLHPRTTGLLFCLRTLLPEMPDLQLLDVTIGYPGVPYGKYPQDWYGLFSVFFQSVPPPTTHIHLHLYSNLSSPDCEIPSLITPTIPDEAVSPDSGIASADEARAFELWLRGVWSAKEKRMEGFYETQHFEGATEIVPVKQLHWSHWISAFGGGGLATVMIVVIAAWQCAKYFSGN